MRITNDLFGRLLYSVISLALGDNAFPSLKIVSRTLLLKDMTLLFFPSFFIFPIVHSAGLFAVPTYVHAVCVCFVRVKLFVCTK